jgi:hypothetical protein
MDESSRGGSPMLFIKRLLRVIPLPPRYAISRHLIIAVLLAVVGTTVWPAIPPWLCTLSISLTAVDWSNYDYNNIDNVIDNVNQIKVRDGHAYIGYFFVVGRPVFGDLTGDGQPEAVIPYFWVGASASPTHVLVYSGNALHPVLLGKIPSQYKYNDNDLVASLSVRSVSISNGELHLAGYGWTPTAPRYCPDLDIEVSYRWNGSQFTLKEKRILSHSSCGGVKTQYHSK